MLIQQSPNKWSCIIYAFATAVDIPASILLELVEHDGSDIVFPDLEEPMCRRAFTVGEVIFAMFKLGYLVTTFEHKIFACNDEESQSVYEVTLGDREAFIEFVTTGSIGVLAGFGFNGIRHAVAWDGVQIHDPLGFVYPLNKFEAHHYFMITRIK